LEKAKSCTAQYAEHQSLGSNYKEIYCRELGNVIECLDKAVESCAGDEFEETLKMFIEQSKYIKKEECKIDLLSEDNEIQECFEENIDYLYDCMHEGVAKVTELLADREDDEHFSERQECGLFIEVTFCAARKLDEKCGREAVKEFARKATVPDGIRDACETVGIVISSGLDEDKRKK